jgi:hypothetical protein
MTERIVSSEDNRIITWERSNDDSYIVIKRILTGENVEADKRMRVLRLLDKEFRALIKDFDLDSLDHLPTLTLEKGVLR